MNDRTDADYIGLDPFMGDESELTCRSVNIVKARKSFKCFGYGGHMDHNIEPGQRYRHERARVDGSFWGQYRICLNCMDKLFDEEDFDDDRAAAAIGEQP